MVALVLSIAVATAATPTPAPLHDPVIAAAGDIACDPRHRLGPDIEAILGGCQAAATFKLIAAKRLAAVLVLGDAQYEDGALEAFQQSYAKTWGRVKAITHPAPGNHEYYSSPNADGYFTYFGAAAGDRAKGYYSFDLGRWHIISLNGNCGFVGGCGAGSKQETWLKADLGRHPAACTLAYWHQPRFSSGTHHSDPTYADLWRDLYAARADIVLGGHDHDYERFAPQTPMGAPDPQTGIREFVVGTGGRSHSIFLRIDKNSEARAGGTFGVLFLTLHQHSYEWHFTPIAGYLFSDSGNGMCHGRR
jgi:hypothetical protein